MHLQLLLVAGLALSVSGLSAPRWKSGPNYRKLYLPTGRRGHSVVGTLAQQPPSPKGIHLWVPAIVGKPHQYFDAIIDTKSSNFWVPSSRCTSETCKHRALYDSSKSVTYKANGTKLELNSLDGRVEGFLSTDGFQFGESYTVTFGEATQIERATLAAEMFDGVIGLGYSDIAVDGVTSPFDVLIAEEGYDEIISFQSNYALVVGGVEEDQVIGRIVYVPITRPSHWQFKIDNIRLVSASRMDRVAAVRAGRNQVTVCAKGCTGEVDAANLFISGPADDVSELNAAIGAVPDKGGYYKIPNCDVSKLPNLALQIGGTPFVLEPTQYVLKQDDSGECISGLHSSATAPAGHWSLGDVFLYHFYTVLDKKNGRVGFGVLKPIQ